ncbi:MAG: hypothetical protein HYV63_19935, partial [Candidatus Schekmanbacteria bacterium]|nr:hypothetical protein [Candidatus Schekmanbacteria bacterium]
MEAGASASSGIDRVFDVGAGASFGLIVQLEGLVIQHGSAFRGGGIQASGAELTLRNVRVADNWAKGTGEAQGGGIAVLGASAHLTIIDSEISGNTLVLGDGDSGYGAGIWSRSASIDIENTAIGGNAVSVTGSVPAVRGGGVYAEALNGGSITGSVIAGNFIDCRASGSGVACNTQGAGIWASVDVNAGKKLVIRGSRIDGNVASCKWAQSASCQVAGGGAYVATGALAIIDSAMTRNLAGSSLSLESRGGGLYVAGGAVDVDDTTISTNVAEAAGNRGYGGAAYFADGMTNLAYVTVADNAADYGAAFARILENASFTIRRSIVAAPAGATACWGGFGSIGYNVVADPSCPAAEPGDQAGVDPLLGALADNGGGTETHQLLAGSPAIDAAGEQACDGGAAGLLLTDQRGVSRPLDGDGDGVAWCDAGAYEADAAAAATATPTPTPSPTATTIPTKTPAPTLTPTAMSPVTPSVTGTATTTPTSTRSPWPTATPTATVTPYTPVVTSTVTPTRPAVASPTPSRTAPPAV